MGERYCDTQSQLLDPKAEKKKKVDESSPCKKKAYSMKCKCLSIVPLTEQAMKMARRDNFCIKFYYYNFCLMIYK